MKLNLQPSWRNTLKALLYLLPALVILGTFNIYPTINLLIMSFREEIDFFSGTGTGFGLGNFIDIFQDPNFKTAFINTGIYIIGVVPISIALSLGIALLLNTKIRFAGALRTVYFMPYVTSVVAIAIVWGWIFNSDYGLVNYLLSLVGIDPINWLTDPNYTMPTLILFSIWKGLGFNIVIFLAGLQTIDKQYILAAKIDGATRWQRFRQIIFPLLFPTTLFVSIISIINGFKVFDEVYALFNGRPGPGNSTLTAVFYIYRKFYEEWDFGMASAAAFVLFFVILIFTLLQFYMGKKFSYSK